MTVLESVETKLGNKIELVGEKGEGQVLIIGVVHGDEPQGKYLIDEYLSFPLHSQLPHLEIKDFGPPADGEDMPNLKVNARILRNNMTKEEVFLWQYIRKRQVEGIKFRRQQKIGKYICDFVSYEPKIVIELDGSQHLKDLQSSKDKIRDDFLIKSGFKVLRFWNNDITHNIESVISKIKETIAECPPLTGGPKSLISRWVELEKRGGKLFIPCLNPDGMKCNTRRNANEVDINRNFPTKNWGQNLGDNATCDDEKTSYYGGKSPASEIETKFVINIIEKYKPRLIITLHAPYKVVNYDGPAKEVAEKISEIIKYPVEASIGYPTPGSFGTWAGVERNIPIITLELDEDCPVEDLIEPVFEIFDMFN